MAVGRAERREDRQARFEGTFGDDAHIALDLFEIIELAWHDCYGAVTPPPEVEEDILVVSEGEVEGLVRAGRLALQDWRDLRRVASELADT
ncbi:MAG: hypothetical protein PVG83_10630 [Acidimicrobiia bacterium]|jgi:hypothetical protein